MPYCLPTLPLCHPTLYHPAEDDNLPVAVLPPVCIHPANLQGDHHPHPFTSFNQHRFQTNLTVPRCSSTAAPNHSRLLLLPLPRRSRDFDACIQTAPARPSSASRRPRATMPCSRSTAKIVSILLSPFVAFGLLTLSSQDACRQRLDDMMCPSPKESSMAKYCNDRKLSPLGCPSSASSADKHAS